SGNAVGMRRPENSQRINAEMAVEPAVLGAQDCLNQRRRKILQPVIGKLERPNASERLAVLPPPQKRWLVRLEYGLIRWCAVQRPQHGAGYGECGAKSRQHDPQAQSTEQLSTDVYS